MQTEIFYDEVFDAQEHYRLILDSMGRPGKINVIPDLGMQVPAGINKASAMIAFALLNTDVSFCAIGQSEHSNAEYIALHTSSPVTTLQKADFVFTPGLQSSNFVAELKSGTLPYPEDSATIIADVDIISTTETPGALALTLKGPGIKDTETLYITGLNTDILDAVKEQNLEFPLGIDLILTDQENNLICIPRSNNFTYPAAN